MNAKKKYEATGKYPYGSGLFASDSEDDVVEWFRRSVTEATGVRPGSDEESYFLDGHDVIRTTSKGEFTWRLEKRSAAENPQA